jgi:hypothetical protein
MTTYKHIVQVHPVENGLPNLAKVTAEYECETKEEADCLIEIWNRSPTRGRKAFAKAVYRGCVNDETGELV